MNLVQTAIVAGAIGAVTSAVTGRSLTRIDNVLVGGLFTMLAAYRDPRSTPVATWLVAATEGAVWGITDRLVPRLKDVVMPSGRSPR